MGLVLVLVAGLSAPAHAVLDINDGGPVLNCGRMSLRVTNAGILGNAFFNVGLSSDPSLEYPSHSGRELLNYAALWVGARTERDGNRVSGGPLLEWRATPDAEDRVRSVRQGELGARSLIDDDGDGRVDEETLNGRDDDGDNEVDEDLRMTAQQMLAADYVDDRPEALYHISEGSESNRPLHLSVHQEVYGWATPGYENIAGLHFKITNHGTDVLRDLYVGMLADLDVRLRNDATGHLNDVPYSSHFWATLNDGCIRRPERSVPVLSEATTSGSASIRPAVATTTESGIPIEVASNIVLGIEKVADRNRAEPGEIVNYRIAVWNTIYYALFTTVTVLDDIPPGFAFVPGSARLDGVPLGDPTGTRQLEFAFVGGMPGANDLNGNGMLDPGEPGYRVLTYQLRVASGAGVGTYFNSAVACTGSTVRVVASDRVQVGVDVRTTGSPMPLVALVPLDHTTDPLASITPARAHARAPADVRFRSMLFERNQNPGSGGLPPADADRYAAMAGNYPGSPGTAPGDYVVLVSCGPFASLAPGQSIEFAAALVVAERADSMNTMVARAMYVHNGFTANLLPDSTGPNRNAWYEGKSGLNGHEVCVEAPENFSFIWDPHCPGKFGDNAPPSMPATYRHGSCIWTDADCQSCSGSGGRETVMRWLDPGAVPPAPDVNVVPLDHAIRIEWNNRPEVLLQAGLTGVSGTHFVGYNVYKLGDWRRRESLLPPAGNWTKVASIGPESDYGQIPLGAVTDSTVEHEAILYRQRVYPPGRYRFTDPDVKNGFDYVYAVSTLTEVRAPDGRLLARLESPLPVTFEDRVTPQAAAKDQSGGVWVVPNPFRAGAGWDRPAVFGDAPTAHIDFMGLPRARCTIRIFTVSGDLVAVLDHDATQGDGQASWDLVSRNGQDVESGIYLFVVESSLGRQIGRFIVIR